MEKIILPVFYLPPISWFSVLVNRDAEFLFEANEHFPKQTYRNRANIYGANGKLSLIIPIHHNGKRVMKDIEISYSESWKQLHWKSIKTAYQSSPYFEFYEDFFANIYKLEEKYLLDFNLKTLDIVSSILKLEMPCNFTQDYSPVLGGEDFREKFSAKEYSPWVMEDYYQTFSDKMGFIKDLSILDLICNKGPESLLYLKNIK